MMLKLIFLVLYVTLLEISGGAKIIWLLLFSLTQKWQDNHSIRCNQRYNHKDAHCLLSLRLVLLLLMSTQMKVVSIPRDKNQTWVNQRNVGCMLMTILPAWLPWKSLWGVDNRPQRPFGQWSSEVLWWGSSRWQSSCPYTDWRGSLSGTNL